MHGDLGQIAREKALKAFRTGDIDVLVATDVAARGIDIDDITHVINYQIPEDEQAYVHRIGRTGRAGKTGIAVTLVDWDELPRWTMIDKALGLGSPDPAETYSSSPHLYDELDIPTEAAGQRRAHRANRRPSGRDGASASGDRRGRARNRSRHAAAHPRRQVGHRTPDASRPRTASSGSTRRRRPARPVRHKAQRPRSAPCVAAAAAPQAGGCRPRPCQPN